jgi:hypothetical protein
LSSQARPTCDVDELHRGLELPREIDRNAGRNQRLLRAIDAAHDRPGSPGEIMDRRRDDHDGAW